MNLPKTPFRFIWHFIVEQWGKFFILVATSFCWGINESFYPYFLKRIVNTIEASTHPIQNIYYAVSGTLLLLVGFWFITETFLRLQGILQIYTFPRFRASIRETVFNYVKSHSQEYFASHFSGNLAKKLADLPTSCQTVVEIVCFQFVTATVGAMVIFVLMWLSHPLFAIILLVWLTLHMSLTFLFLHYGNHLWITHSDTVSALSGKIVDVFSNILNVRLFARSRYETEYLNHFQQDEIAKAKKAMWVIEVMRIGQGLSGLFLIFGMVFALLYGWEHHWITIGDFTQIGMQSFWILGWVWFISYQVTVFSREIGVINSALSLVRKGHDIVDSTTAYPLAVSQGKVEFENVDFTYHRNQPVFRQMNVTIEAGQKVGLVGFSGSGKSTFVNLILRFYDLQNGRILIDGQNIAHATQESLRAQIAMIPQDLSLFHRTLMENIRYGRLDASDEEVMNASKLAHCHEFIQKLDDGYQSLVGERGVKLSGGQRQRIAIARAMLKNAPILILDEATSALDSVTEKLIQESLQTLMTGRTTIVIAHRLSTLSNMDKLLVFHKGKIIEEGTKEKLLKTKGHFATLWNMQTDGFLPETS